MITLPTLAQLDTEILQALESQFDATINEEGKAFLRALAAVQAAKIKNYYLAVGLLQKNIFVDTCDEETLIRFGTIKIGRQPFPATAGVYTLQVTGTIGGVIPALTTFKSDDDSLSPSNLFILDADFTMTGSTDSITVRALLPGLDSELEAGDTLTSTTPIPLVDSEAEVLTISTTPLAGETIEAYRTAVINSYRIEAQGGAAGDYRIWSADAQGVQRVYPYAKSNATSEVNLYVEATTDDSSDGKGTPTQSILDDVETVVNFNPDTTLSINERGRRPLQVIVNYLAVTPKNIDVTITGGTFSVTEKANLLTNITNYVNDIRPFVAAADLVADMNDTISVNGLTTVVGVTKPGAVYTSISLSVAGVPLTSYQFLNGDIPYFNSVTYN